MKVKGAKKVHYESGPNMTPLVDVTMVILIFLMLAGSFGNLEHFVASKTPIQAKGAGGAPVAKDWKPPTTVDVQVSAKGDAKMPDKPDWIQDPEVFKAQVETKLAEFRNASIDMKNVMVVLHPETGTKWSALMPLYDAALRSKAEKVSFAMATR